MNLVDEERALAKRLDVVNALENPVSYLAGGGLALLYFMWRWHMGVIAIYTWVIPFGVAFAAAKLGFTIVETRIERRIKALHGGELPVARALAAPPPPEPPAPPSPARVPLVEPPPAPDPPKPGEPPRLLK